MIALYGKIFILSQFSKSIFIESKSAPIRNIGIASNTEHDCTSL